MIRLSVNVNKVATLRNSRGGSVPSVVDAVDVCVAAGAPGITVHPRADRRHILPEEVRPGQCTLVPVAAGEITSHAGWQPGSQTEGLADVVRTFKSRGIRVSLFVDPVPGPIQWAASVGADRVELYTEPFARAFARGAEAGRESFET